MSFKAPLTTYRQPQHMEALDKANRLRLQRAAMKRELRHCKTRAESFAILASYLDVDTIPDFLTNATLPELLRACREVKDVVAMRVCLRLDIPESKTVGSLTARQRTVIATYLRRGHAPVS